MDPLFLPRLFLPSPAGGSSLFCCSLLEKDDEELFADWARASNRSFSINNNFLFRASISISLLRSSTWTNAKPSSHSLLISTTAALVSISMIEVNLLWKATLLAIFPAISSSPWLWGRGRMLNGLGAWGQITQKERTRRGSLHHRRSLRWKIWKCNTIATGNSSAHVMLRVYGAPDGSNFLTSNIIIMKCGSVWSFKWTI